MQYRHLGTSNLNVSVLCLGTMMFGDQTEFGEESLVIAQQVKTLSDARGCTPGQFATAWVLANPIISGVIAGPRTLAQLEDYYPAIDIAISAEEEVYIDSLVAPGHASTPGYNDPNYPFFGRPIQPATA